MFKNVVTKLALMTVLTISSQTVFAGPGAGGGTGTGSAEPATAKHISNFRSEFRLALSKIFNFLEHEYEDASGLFKKVLGKDVFQRIQDVNIEFKETGRCPLPKGMSGDPEAVAIPGIAGQKDLICFNLEKLLNPRRKVLLTTSNFRIEMLSLASHELAHLQGLSEHESKRLEEYLRARLLNDFKYYFEARKFEADIHRFRWHVERLLEMTESKTGPSTSAECLRIGKLRSYAQIIRTKVRELRNQAVSPVRSEHIDLAAIRPLVRIHNFEIYCEEQQDPRTREYHKTIFQSRHQVPVNDYYTNSKIVMNIFTETFEIFWIYKSSIPGVIRKVDVNDRANLIRELGDLLKELQNVHQALVVSTMMLKN